MTFTRGSLVAATLLASIALTGCGSTSSEGGSAPAEKPKDPKAAIAASTDGLKEGNYAFTTKTPTTDSKGVMHLPSKSAGLEANNTSEDGDLKLEIRLIDPDRWMKMTMDTSAFEGMEDIDTSDPQMAKLAEQMNQMKEMFSGKSWMHVDTSKVKGGMAKSLGIEATDGDLTGLSVLLDGVVTAQGDGKTITGTLDATKVAKDVGMVDTDEIKTMGASASALPYTATLDDKGRISTLDLDVPKAGDVPAGKWTFNVTGYGEQKAQEKPSGPVKEMPASAYDMLNN